MKKTQLQQLRKENKLRAQFLSNASQETLRTTLQYADASRMSAFDREVLYKYIVGMALAAEQQGRTLAETLGGDLKAACQGMVEGIGPAEPKERLLYDGWYTTALAALAVLVHFQTPGMAPLPGALPLCDAALPFCHRLAAGHAWCLSGGAAGRLCGAHPQPASLQHPLVLLPAPAHSALLRGVGGGAAPGLRPLHGVHCRTVQLAGLICMFDAQKTEGNLSSLARKVPVAFVGLFVLAALPRMRFSGKGVPLSADSGQRPCLWIPQAFEKA